MNTFPRMAKITHLFSYPGPSAILEFSVPFHMDLELLKYPVGKYTPPDVIGESDLITWSKIIFEFPEKLHREVKELTESELSWRYRPEGWTIHQVVHHCADSHMNAFIRFKLTMTENEPAVLGYQQHDWAQLADVQQSPIVNSIMILRGLHTRWSQLLKIMTPSDFDKRYLHQEYNKKFSLRVATGLYAWHCGHHLAHIKQALHYKGEY